MMRTTGKRLQHGTTMIEVLVSAIISVIGLLGIASFQMRTYGAESESFQRAQANILLRDMVNRINANRSDAAAYVADDIGVGAAEDCTAATTQTEADHCEWGNLLRGLAETQGTTNLGAMTAARGCITQVGTRTFVVAVVWEGITPTGAPPTACGQNDYSSEALRRAVTAVVTIGDLG